MSNAGYIGLSLQMGLRRQMDVVANNVANLSTSGFKGSSLLFIEQLTKAPKSFVQGPSPRLSMVVDAATYRDTSQGSFIQTGNQMDIMLQGDGYLVVQAANGTRYTRAGGMQLNADRQLCDRNGFPVQGEGGPITIPATDNKITITSTGTVVTESGVQGNLQIVRFANEQNLQAASGGTYTTTDTPLPASDTVVQQGGIEGSNVQGVTEMTRMIELQRAYENVQHMLDSENDREKDAVSKLTNLS
jgi:flagellar basal-body rod protein FlgF